MRQKLFIAFLLVAFACKAEKSAAPPSPADVQSQASGIAQRVGDVASAAPAGAPALSSPPPVSALPRMIVRTAEATLVVGDTAVSIDRLTALAAANGGYVTDSRLWRDGEQLRATLTLRVPAAKLDGALAALRKLAVRIESETVSGDDVSQEYVDLASQVRNLEAAEAEMRGLMGTVRERTKKAEDILAVYQQLTQLRGEIEKAKGRMQYLSQMSALSTIKVTLVPDAIAKPVVEPGWQPVAVMKDATRALLKTGQAVADAAIWLVIYFGPFALLAIGFLFLLARAVARRRQTRTAGVPAG